MRIEIALSVSDRVALSDELGSDRQKPIQHGWWVNEAGEGGRTLYESSNFWGKQQIFSPGAATASVSFLVSVAADDELHAIMEAWPMLPLAMRAGIVAMIQAAKAM